MKPWSGWHELDEEIERVERLIEGLSITAMKQRLATALATVRPLPERLGILEPPADLPDKKRHLRNEAREIEKRNVGLGSEIRNLRQRLRWAEVVDGLLRFFRLRR